jgi:hypothetical protein
VQQFERAVIVSPTEMSDILFTEIRFGRFHRSGWSTCSDRSVTAKPCSK